MTTLFTLVTVCSGLPTWPSTLASPQSRLAVMAPPAMEVISPVLSALTAMSPVMRVSEGPAWTGRGQGRAQQKSSRKCEKTPSWLPYITLEMRSK